MDLARAREKAKARKKNLEAQAPPEPLVKAEAPEEIPVPGPAPVSPAAGGTAPEKTSASEGAAEAAAETQVIVEKPALSTPAPISPAESEAAEPAEPEEAHELLGFTLGQEEYGIEIQWIEEIIKPRPATEVPRSPDYIPGIISLRGKIIPIMELERRLRLTPAGAPPAAGGTTAETGRIIVVSDPETKQSFGLKVGEVTEVIRLPFKELEPPPPTAGGEAGFITGVGWVGKKMIIMLNLTELLKLESGGRTAK
ncbi:MAG: chemotaxis protein CheW [bacterium]|nr:chemotaxis protein CheW [bacterium]